jgi:hypothetical protein
VLNNLGGYVYLDGRWDEALELAERARTAFQKIGDESHATIAARTSPRSLRPGTLDEAEPILRSVLEIRRAGGLPLEIAEASSVVGRHEARVGRFEEA